MEDADHVYAVFDQAVKQDMRTDRIFLIALLDVIAVPSSRRIVRNEADCICNLAEITLGLIDPQLCSVPYKTRSRQDRPARVERGRSGSFRCRSALAFFRDEGFEIEWLGRAALFAFDQRSPKCL